MKITTDESNPVHNNKYTCCFGSDDLARGSKTPIPTTSVALDRNPNERWCLGSQNHESVWTSPGGHFFYFSILSSLGPPGQPLVNRPATGVDSILITQLLTASAVSSPTKLQQRAPCCRDGQAGNR